MLTLQVPTLLALLGTVLMAVVIFAPVPAAAKVTLSPAPPLMPSPNPSRTPPLPFERWDAPPDDVFTPPFLEREPGWPALVDARAAGCDAAARLALVDALVAVRAPWADAILQRALDDEPDALVRDAIGAARERSDAR